MFCPQGSRKKVSAQGLVYFLKKLELNKWLFSSNYMEDSNWKNDVALEQDLRNYVRRNLKWKEILDFMKRDYE